jgi:hypothetical protein
LKVGFLILLGGGSRSLASPQSLPQPAVESIVKEAPEQVVVASLEKGQEEKANIVDAPDRTNT